MEREVATVRRLYDAFARRDWTTAGECFAEDAFWHLPGRSPIAGDYRGRKTIMADLLTTLPRRSNGTLRTELVDVLVGEQAIVALQHATGEREGRQLDLTACQVMKFRDGRIAEIRGHYLDLYQLDEFWS